VKEILAVIIYPVLKIIIEIVFKFGLNQKRGVK